MSNKTTIVIEHPEGQRHHMNFHTDVLGYKPVVLAVGDLSEENASLRARVDQLEEIARWYKYSYTGNEPSVSVLDRMVDEAGI